MTRLNATFDQPLLDAIAAEFDLRAPNKEALRQLIFTISGSYDPSVMQVLNLATGVGKTYLMAAFIEYLRRQGSTNVMIVTPGKTVQRKTVQNFTAGAARFIKGAEIPPQVVTPQDYSAWVACQNGAPQLSYGRDIPTMAFIFNIQQLIAPKDSDGDTHGATQEAMRRKPRRFDENAGVLFDYLRSLDDLVVIADESHLYGKSAAAFHAALKELQPAATIGLTASSSKGDHVIFTYPLYRAIADRFVKAPVLAFRKKGYGDDQASEEQQLRDALQLRSIKQRHYDLYAETQRRAHLNAVVFVVCADVEHASQVADLLRSPGYLNSEQAVLQVDSKHEDELTQRLLEDLDAPHSPVLAVVSVNKLKEGWDVKSIAVVVTLRAMASEVLTQQTMGRGLRLPFGAYTDIYQIDQLDIISHRSFRELLAAENVLEQFGLEDAVDKANQPKIVAAIRRVAEHEISLGALAVVGREAALDGAEGSLAGADPSGEVPAVASIPGLSVRRLDDEMWASEPGELEPVVLERNPSFKYVAYYFPRTSLRTQQLEVQLSDIAPDDIERAARRVTSTGDVMIRKEIVAALGRRLRAEDTESAEVESQRIDEADARQALTRLAMNNQLIPTTKENIRLVEGYLVDKFMQQVTFGHWTLKSLESASDELDNLVREYADRLLAGAREFSEIHPKLMPARVQRILPPGSEVHDQIDSRNQFVKGCYYRGWFKGLFTEESFDSYSGEYLLAKLLNTSPHIKWWHRLHPRDDAFIHYTPTARYYPDFVALDDEETYWIIEGKDERGRDDETVQAKRRAAEKTVRRIIACDEFHGQKWGYLIAYESDVQKADTWGDLKAASQPITN